MPHEGPCIIFCEMWLSSLIFEDPDDYKFAMKFINSIKYPMLKAFRKETWLQYLTQETIPFYSFRRFEDWLEFAVDSYRAPYPGSTLDSDDFFDFGNISKNQVEENEEERNIREFYEYKMGVQVEQDLPTDCDNMGHIRFKVGNDFLAVNK